MAGAQRGINQNHKSGSIFVIHVPVFCFFSRTQRRGALVPTLLLVGSKYMTSSANKPEKFYDLLATMIALVVFSCKGVEDT